MAYFKQIKGKNILYPQVFHTKSTSYPHFVDNVDMFKTLWKTENFLIKSQVLLDELGIYEYNQNGVLR